MSGPYGYGRDTTKGPLTGSISANRISETCLLLFTSKYPNVEDTGLPR